MRKRIFIVFLVSFSTGFLSAQKVLYSPYLDNQPETRFEVIGKAGNYYWIQKSRKKARTKKQTEPRINEDFSFEIYDARMNPVKTIPFSVSGNFTKEYFVPGNEYLDQLVFLPVNPRITVLLNRYTPDGNIILSKDTLGDFPGPMNSGDFLLIRSQDKTKLLLLGIEFDLDSPLR